MTLDLHTVKEDFAVMVQKVQPWTLSQFVMWLDLKVAEYKVHGYMILDYEDRLNKLFPAELKKHPCRNASSSSSSSSKQSDINTAKTHLRTAPSMISPPQSSVITLDSDSPPTTVSSQTGFSRTRNNSTNYELNSEVTHLQLSNPQNNHIFTRNSQIIDLESPASPLGSYNYSRNLSKPTQYIDHESQPKIINNGQKTGLVHSRNITPNQSQTNNSENNFSATDHHHHQHHHHQNHQKTVLQGCVGSEANGRGIVNVSSQNVDGRLENQANSNVCLTRDESQMELLMDVVIDEDYSPDNWNSSSGTVQDTTSNNFQSNKDKQHLPLLSIPAKRDIKIEDVKHCLDDEKFSLLADSTNNPNDVIHNEYSDSDMEDENSHNSQHDAVIGEQLWTTEELKDFSNAVISRRRYIGNRFKPNISLPVFSGYLQNMLETGKAQFVWSKLVEQCAYHILAQKDIREKHDYREFCHALYQQYPSIGLEGPQPWSHFSKTLSQKIRHIRWQLKKRSTLSGDVQKNTVSGMNDTARPSSPSIPGLNISTNNLIGTSDTIVNTVVTLTDSSNIPVSSLQVVD